MADKKPTQVVTGKPTKSTPNDMAPENARGAGGGGPFGPKDKDKNFHGGQSEQAYHGYGRLGEQDIKSQENVNDPSDEN